MLTENSTGTLGDGCYSTESETNRGKTSLSTHRGWNLSSSPEFFRRRMPSRTEIELESDRPESPRVVSRPGEVLRSHP
ncbi:hypothetical protein AB1N83_014187 [Pleurotus pulmonarius]